MRRRPSEFWWIAAFGLFSAIQALLPLLMSGRVPLDGWSLTDRNLVAGYGAAWIVTAVLLLAFSSIGRWAATCLLGVAAADQVAVLAEAQAHDFRSTAVPVLKAAFCAWMVIYLQRPSTARLFQLTREQRRKQFGGMQLIDFVDLALALLVAKGVHMVSGQLWLGVIVGIAVYALYGLLLEDWVRHRWSAWFSSPGAGFPDADVRRWKSACHAFADHDYAAARELMDEASAEAREHAASRFLYRMCDWQEMIEAKAFPRPLDGRSALRRMALDHDWQPNDVERRNMADAAENLKIEHIHSIVEERFQLLDGLIHAGLTASDFFHNRADRALTRITGEAFAFNPQESWAAWWQERRDDYHGDIGMVALVTRLVRLDSYEAAHALATRCAARAEEPMLKDFTGQVVFLNSMQRAIREHRSVEPFIRQPRQILLVPEITDAVGLLHGDSQLLETLGMTMQQVSRRLQLRVPMVDYIGRLWRRYPGELNADMPWLLQTLTHKNLGILRARAKFESWWPEARASFVRHDRAVADGMVAMAADNVDAAEKAFRAALAEQPRELSSRYNLVLCLVRKQNQAEAVRLLRELTELEPKEPYWWIVLGDLQRTANHSTDAYASFKKALDLGAAEGRVALHLGLTFARDKRDAEAITQLDRALGRNPSASKIEALVSALESEGLWELAGHYRDEAFRRGLSRTGGGDDDDDEREERPGGEDALA